MLYPVICDSFANLDNALEIWIKFTSHLKPEEKDYLEVMKSKSLSSTSIAELEKYLQIKNQLWMVQLFARYKNKDCTKEEKQAIISFMKSSLKAFIKERLTEEEKEEASVYLSKIQTIEELKLYKEKQKDYCNLSVVEAYVLFEVKEKLADLEHIQLQDKIEEENKIARRNLIKDVFNTYY